MTRRQTPYRWGHALEVLPGDERYCDECSDCGRITLNDDIAGGLCPPCRDERCCDECGDVVERKELVEHVCDRCRAESVEGA